MDIALISNYATANLLRKVWELQGEPIYGKYFKPMEYFLDENEGSVYCINSSPHDLLNRQGIREARKQFFAALKHARDNGAKVVLFAASLKRLFGAEQNELVDYDGVVSLDGKTIMDWFPEILFTNGDNGTAVILRDEIDGILEKATIGVNRGYVAVLGGGLLGVEAIKHLRAKGLKDKQIKVVSTMSNDIKSIANGTEIGVFDTVANIDVDVNTLLCCTHNKPLSADDVENLGIKHVLDVAVPAGFTEEQYFKCKNVYRQDGGNAYNPYIDFFFDSSIIGLAPKEMYGCFCRSDISRRIYQ